MLTLSLLYASAFSTSVLAQVSHDQSEDLREAAHSNDLTTVKKLGDRGVDVNNQGEFNDTALTWAANHNNLAMVTYLLDHGAKPNGLMAGFAFRIRDAVGGTALSFAIANKNVTMVRELLAHHVDVEEPDDEHIRPLMKAASKGQVAIAKLLLDAGAKPDARNDWEGTALMYAAPSVEVMQLLLNRGAKVDAVDHSGHTPLFYAVGNPAAIRFLLAHGATVNTVASFGETPLLCALYNPETVQVLLDAGADVEYLQESRFLESGTALIQAAKLGCAETVKVLLKHGAKVGRQTAEGRTALMNAGVHGNIETMQALLAGGADVHQQDKWGRTALMWTAAWGKAARLRVLLVHGANIREEDNYGETAFLMAVHCANAGTTRFLLERGADLQTRIRRDNPGEKLYQGDTVLLQITNAQDSDNAVLRLLLNKGAAVNATNKKGITALMHTAQSNNVEGTKLLLAHGAKLNMRDKNGQTALMHALHSSTGIMREVARLLLQAGATIAYADKPLIKALLKEQK